MFRAYSKHSDQEVGAAERSNVYTGKERYGAICLELQAVCLQVHNKQNKTNHSFLLQETDGLNFNLIIMMVITFPLLQLLSV